MGRNSKHLSGALPFLLCLVMLGAGCESKGRGRVNPFPEAAEATGWTRNSGIRTFPAAELWKYIDGDAEKYLKAGVQSVLTADYKYWKNIDAVVDLYSMSTAEGAKSIFESEPAGDAKLISLGDGARLYGQTLVFRKDKHLIRITAYEQSKETQEAILELGRAIERKLSR